MNEEMILKLAQDTLRITAMLAGPMLIGALVVGLIVSILQAITQINESTLTFIPKMVAIVLVLMVMAPWMLKVMENYTVYIIGNAHDWIR